MTPNKRHGKKGGAWYWHFLEFGTAKQPPQPYMRPAFEAKKVEAAQDFSKLVQKALVSETKRLAKLGGK